ncbi:sugar ABC transporter ATP-binding protein [Leifsonia sp. YAF41]|uniref:sugar ABC transporter ATP-binding protein n=1 Tax=Leifsonia sp. YAF41 TaxID=3233086 RepID=UPI003F9E0D23
MTAVIHPILTDELGERPPLLQVVGASKSFPGVKALQNVRLEVRHNEVLALVGENGAGKSTLMKLLSGIYTPDEGEFFLNGEKLQINNPRHAQELGISIIHQEFNLANDLTVAQNIFIGREPRRAGIFLSERELNQKAQDLFDRLGLALNPRQRVGELTVARQQMVEIAKALSFNAKVLIMDEPTAALNDAEVATLFELIERFTTPETGVIYISHRMDELKVISDRISVLRDGQYIATVDTQATDMTEVISLMVGREITGEARPQGADVRGEVVLSVNGLSTKHLLNDVSFELRRGEILGFAGLMGAGRTEVARAIVGADPKTAGRIELNGTPVQIGSPAIAAGLGIGYLSEDRKALGVLLERDVKENIALGSLPAFASALGFMKTDAIQATAQKQVSALSIKTPSIDQLVKNLSGGNQQKVVIAKWLVKDCDILIFDEPTRGIDVGAKDEIYALLNALAAEGKAIIMISSELPEVLRMSHRIAVMCEGRLNTILDNADATQENIMDYATRARTEGLVTA